MSPSSLFPESTCSCPVGWREGTRVWFNLITDAFYPVLFRLLLVGNEQNIILSLFSCPYCDMLQSGAGES